MWKMAGGGCAIPDDTPAPIAAPVAGPPPGGECVGAGTGVRRVRCGLYMAAKKRPKFDRFIEDARLSGLDVVDIDLDAADDSASAHFQLDAILHKITDDMASAEMDPDAARRLANFEAVLASNPRAALIDPLSGIRPLLNRAEMQHVLASIIADLQLDVVLPKWVTIPARSRTQDIVAALDAAGMRAPYLCKTEAACGVPYSHEMAVFSEANQLEEFTVPGPWTIQEFQNHGGVIYKVYVLGDEWFVDVRPSLVDTDASTSLKVFNSQKLSESEDIAAPPLRDKDLSEAAPPAPSTSIPEPQTWNPEDCRRVFTTCVGSAASWAFAYGWCIVFVSVFY